MRLFLTLVLFFSLAPQLKAQSNNGKGADEFPGTGISSFDGNTKIISFGLGFPDLYRVRYDEPAGYTHIKTTGFGPFYAKFEFSAIRNIGLQVCFGYSTFHYSYHGLPQVVYYDDVNTLNLSFSGNYHFNKLVTNPRLDVYAGAGLAVDYQKYTYGNIPPYRSPDIKAHIHPVFRVGTRYYLDRVFGVFGEAGYDGLSVIGMGCSIRF